MRAKDGGENGEKKRGMLPEEMMKPKNECQGEEESERQRERGTEQNMVGMEERQKQRWTKEETNYLEV